MRGTGLRLATAAAAMAAFAALASAADRQPKLRYVPFAGIEWTETPDGRAVATVSGDRTRGEHTTFIRFPAGMKSPPHTHTLDYHGLIVKGVARHYMPGSPEETLNLSAGSYYFVPGGTPHVSECLPDTECIFAIHQNGPFDRNLVD